MIKWLKRNYQNVAAVVAIAALLLLLSSCASVQTPGDAGTAAVQPKTDLEWIVALHQNYPNFKWEPAYSLDDHEGMRTHLYVVPHKQIVAACGKNTLACQVLVLSEESVADVNAEIMRQGESADKFLEVGSCVIFMPPRPEKYPMAWFYLLGHEFAHCRYGNFHPIHADEVRAHG